MRRLTALELRWILLGAFGVRAALALAVTAVGLDANKFGLVLDDEASYYRATALLATQPLGTPLTPTLEHLGGNAYVGLATALALATGPSTLWPRLLNALLGTLVVLLVARSARVHLGPTAVAPAAALAALWPASVIWGAFMLRDTLVALVVMALWWSTTLWSRGERLLGGLLAALCLSLLAGMREYVAALAVAALVAWGLARPLARLPWRVVGIVVLAAGLAGTAVVAQSGLLDRAARALVYRQAVVQLETQGMLYVEPPPDGLDGSYLPGELVAVTAAPADNPRLGVVHRYVDRASREVAFIQGDTTIVGVDDLAPMHEAPVSPAWLIGRSLAGLGGSIVGVGSEGIDRPSALAWVAAALAWDALFATAAVGLWRQRRAWRTYVFPIVMALGTLTVLAGVPSGIGNAARHLAAHATPALIVLAVGAVASPGALLAAGARREAGRMTSSTSPSAAMGPAASPTR
jgi:hypothetical protein